MHHATLAGAHGFELVGLASVFYLVDGFFGEFAEICGTLCFEAVGVEGDAVVVFWFEAEDLGGDVLERTEQLAILIEQEFCVRPFALDVNVTAFEAVWISRTGACRDAELKPKTTRCGQ